MKKEELFNFGIPEEKINEFRAVYWADVKKQAAKMAERERETPVSPASIREAIRAMVNLIEDEKRLAMILSNTNRHYAQYLEEMRVKGYTQPLPPAPTQESEGAQNVPEN